MLKEKKMKVIVAASASACVLGIGVVTALLGVGPSASKASNEGEVEYVIEDKETSVNTSIKYAADDMSSGTILHAWCWSFDTIRENLADIKAAGYTSVQTSPASKCKVGNNGDMSVNNWYYHYQPTAFEIGNYQLGSEEDFALLCEEAEEYGIRIIVDAVFNHMSGDWYAIDEKYRVGSYYHTNYSVSDWGNRWDVTQNALLGLWDLNTQNEEVQQMALEYAKKCVSLGADGFRYDAAKHVELPDDPGYGGNFWPVVLDNGSEFQYGEILQDSISRDSAYSEIMGVTASGYGHVIRDAVANCNFSVDKIKNYGIDAAANRTVTWVESHDNFANDNCETVWMTNEQIKLAWAVLAARNGSAPLFYNRPVGAGGTSYDSRFPGKSKLGDAGDSFYKDDEIAAVNIFRNMMEGESENLKNIDSDSVLMIERGTKGVVIVNSEYAAKEISVETNLADGEYVNNTDDASLFTVVDGVLTGVVPARGIAVLYHGGTAVANAPRVGIEGYSANMTTVFREDSIELNLTTSNSTAATYQIDDGKSYLYEDGKTLVIGKDADYDSVITVTLKAENDDATKTAVYKFKKVDPAAGLTLTFTKPSSWSNTIYAYIYSEDGYVREYASWPGTVMENIEGDDYLIQIDDTSYDGGFVIFSDGQNQIPASQETGFIIEKGGAYNQDGLVEDSDASNNTTEDSNTEDNTDSDSSNEDADNNTNDDSSNEGSDDNTNDDSSNEDTDDNTSGDSSSNESSSSDKMVIYYSTNWTSPYIHYELGGTWTEAPGKKMVTSDVSGYYKAEIEMGSEKYLKFCFNNGYNSWDNNGGNDYAVNSVGTYTIKNGRIMSGAPSDDETDEITIYYKSSETTYIHYRIGNGSWTEAPGEKMSSGSEGYKTITISLGNESSLTACFNDGNGKWDNNNGNDYYFFATGAYTLVNGQVTVGAPY